MSQERQDCMDGIGKLLGKRLGYTEDSKNGLYSPAD